jgi:SET domain-containing protein
MKVKDKVFVHKGLRVEKSKIHGYGVFTYEDIRKGDIIEECVVPFDTISYGYSYLGEKAIQFNSEILQNYRFAAPMNEQMKETKFFVMPLGNAAIYNHSDDPNVEWYHDTEHRLIVFRALRDIEADEELCHYYGVKEKDLILRNKQYEASNTNMDNGIFVGDNNER